MVEISKPNRGYIFKIIAGVITEIYDKTDKIINKTKFNEISAYILFHEIAIR